MERDDMEQLTLPLELVQRCEKCRTTKPIDAFHWANRAKAKRQTMCRECFRAYNRARYLAKRDMLLAQCRAHHAANRDAIIARQRAKYWRDVEASQAAARAHARVQNAKPERKTAKREWARRDRAANPEKWREMDRQQYRRNPTYYQEIQWRRRAQKLATMVGPVTVALLEAKRAYWGNRCWLCGGEATEMDHVKPLTKGGAHMLCNLRPACRSCNARKRDTWPLTA